MRCLTRNQKSFTVCNYVSKTKQMVNNQWNGNWQVNYGSPVHMVANIAPASNRDSIEEFGTSLQYDRMIAIDDPNVNITENSVLWIDREYAANTPHDYIVVRVARSINSVRIAVRKVPAG